MLPNVMKKTNSEKPVHKDKGRHEAFRETGASLLFSRRAHLLTTRFAGGGIPPCGRARALFTNCPPDTSPEGQTMPPRFAAISIVCASVRRLSPYLPICSDAANRCSCPEQHLPSACENLLLQRYILFRRSSFSQLQAVSRKIGLFSFACVKRNKIAPCGAERT